ncbi:hypothetical protein NPIL_296831 [Nephila pilipes]|uniref:Secreted protein n=1 Tax=Nephila pilipes TaxID=299642 RepID=A0A8X6NYP9_NEPPI|nr:hypothetical protein NPIL_296831 [Nephila pilipes]
MFSKLRVLCQLLFCSKVSAVDHCRLLKRLRNYKSEVNHHSGRMNRYLMEKKNYTSVTVGETGVSINISKQNLKGPSKEEINRRLHQSAESSNKLHEARRI